MAAETLTATRAADTFPVFKASGAGIVCAAYGTYAVAANVEDGDIFEMCKIPGGATIVGGHFYGADLDTGTEALDMDCGWAANGNEAADPDGFGNFGTITGDAVAGIKPEVSIFLPFGGAMRTVGPRLFTAETVVQIEANTASNAGHTGTITVAVLYFIDPNFTV